MKRMTVASYPRVWLVGAPKTRLLRCLGESAELHHVPNANGFQQTGFGAQRDVFVDPLTLIPPIDPLHPPHPLPISQKISSYDHDIRSRGGSVRSCRPPHAGKPFALSGQRQTHHRGHWSGHILLVRHSRELTYPRRCIP